MPDLRPPIPLVIWTGWLTVRSSVSRHPGRHTGRHLRAATHA